MKVKEILNGKRIVMIIVLGIITVLPIYSQLATSSMKVNFINFSLSQDSKTITYDVYVQDVDPVKKCGIAGYTIRVQAPMESLGENAKSITLTDCNPLIGAGNVIVSKVQTNWLIKFSSTELVTTWEKSQIVNSDYPGTKLATINITNRDGSGFQNLHSINMRYSPGAIHKSMLNLFLEGTNKPAEDAITALSIEQFSGLGKDATGQNHELAISSNNSKEGDLLIYNNPTSDGFNVNVSEEVEELRIYDLHGKLKLTTPIKGESYVSVKELNKGVYLVLVNNRSTKLIKK